MTDKLNSIITVGVVIFVSLSSFCEAQTLFEYLPANAQTTPALSPSSVSNGITVTDLTAGSGLFAEAGSYSWSDWNDSSVSPSNALAANDLWTWGFTVDSGPVNLTALSLALQKSADGPDDVDVQASINGGTGFSVLSQSFGGSTAVNSFSANQIGSVPTLNTGDSIAFTLTGFNSASPFGSLSLQGIPGSTAGLIVEGTLVAIPEPTTTSLLALGLIGCGLVRRRKS